MIGVNVRSDEKRYALLICTGEKLIETRSKNVFKSHIGERVYIIETGVGVATIIGEATIGEPKIYQTREEIINDVGLHLVDVNSKYFGRIKYGYPMLNPCLYEKPFMTSSKGRVIRKIN